MAHIMASEGDLESLTTLASVNSLPLRIDEEEEEEEGEDGEERLDPSNVSPKLHVPSSTTGGEANTASLPGSLQVSDH